MTKLALHIQHKSQALIRTLPQSNWGSLPCLLSRSAVCSAGVVGGACSCASSSCCLPSPAPPFLCSSCSLELLPSASQSSTARAPPEPVIARTPLGGAWGSLPCLLSRSVVRSAGAMGGACCCASSSCCLPSSAPPFLCSLELLPSASPSSTARTLLL